MDRTTEAAIRILSETCKKYKHHEKYSMQGMEKEKLHHLKVLEWVRELDSNPSQALELAALFHDIDRIVNPGVAGGFKGDRKSKAYLRHKRNHARRSADFAASALKGIVKDKKTMEKTLFLIAHHDDDWRRIKKAKSPELECLVAADVFGFFETYAQRIHELEGEERLRDKVRFMVEKLPDKARIMLWEHELKDGISNRIKNEVIKEYYIKNNPGEKIYKFCPNCRTRLSRKKKLKKK